jgi:polar amino acid transport system permease protein
LRYTTARFNPLSTVSDRLSRWPWWALVAALLGVLFAASIATDEAYQGILTRISEGIVVTLRVTMIAYSIALVLGLVIALGRVSNHTLVYQIATFYVEIVRGVPTLVLLLYIAFVLFPLSVEGLNALGTRLIELNSTSPNWFSDLLAQFGQSLVTIQLRDIENEVRVIAALSIAYSAFLAEIYRAGIESVDRGQMEAARALGMGYWQAMRHVILRQAIRQALPPLGNDFIAMLKDSSLVSVLGVLDITRRGTLEQARTFKTLETYSVVAYLYLVMTLLLSMVVKWIERAMARERG